MRNVNEVIIRPVITEKSHAALDAQGAYTFVVAKEANKINELPVNHSPKFAPVLHPTLRTGVEALVVAACAWLPA